MPRQRAQTTFFRRVGLASRRTWRQREQRTIGGSFMRGADVGTGGLGNGLAGVLMYWPGWRLLGHRLFQAFGG